MFTKTNNMIDAASKQTVKKKIPIYHSTVPKIRAQLRVGALVVASTMFGTFVGASGAHAQTTQIAVDMPVVLAQQTPPGGSTDRPGPPPREAIAACANQPAESSCGFQGRDGQQVEGTCRAPDADIPPVCVPADMPHKG